MNTLLNRTLATLILTGVSATALAVPATIDSHTSYSVGGHAETSPRYQVMEDTYLADNSQGLNQHAPRAQYEEDVTNPLVTLPELTWVSE